ncbi:MAG: SDR family NAD(P)-dependent oxidoreductase [Prolixibacteraceae bacterium]
MKTNKGKVAVVTGAGGTLCSEMAKELGMQGYKVVLIGRTLENLKTIEDDIVSKGGIAISLSADVTDEKSIQEAQKVVMSQFGACAILINGAGGNQFDAITTINEFDPKELESTDQVRGFFNLSMDKYRSVVDINTMGTVIPCFVFGKDMAANGGGCIINFASMNSYRPLSRVGAYALAKAGIVNFTQWLAAYLAPANVRVNGIAPGFFLNKNSIKRLMKEDGTYSERGENIIKHSPMKRFGEANELIGCMNWMIDEKASGFLTGVTIPIDGGFLSSSGL